jgi:hypothetical protein
MDANRASTAGLLDIPDTDDVDDLISRVHHFVETFRELNHPRQVLRHQGTPGRGSNGQED